VVNKRTGLPGDGYKAIGREDMDSVKEKVFAYPWKRMKNPFGSYGWETKEIYRSKSLGGTV
jgi:hypothetical protein